MRQAITIVASCAALLAVPAAQQQPAPAQPPPFKTGVDALQLDVSVLDSQRRPVRGLTAADFTVLEDAKPARIVGFSHGIRREWSRRRALSASSRGTAARRVPLADRHP